MKHKIRIQQNRKSGQKKEITVDGITYRTMKVMYEALNINKSNVNNYRRAGMSDEEAIDYAIEKSMKRKKKMIRK